jgi:hypothetical protein
MGENPFRWRHAVCLSENCGNNAGDIDHISVQSAGVV